MLDTQTIEAVALKRLLAKHAIPLLMLTTGREVGLGSLLRQAGIDCISMTYSMTVSATVLFINTLYQQLLDGQNVDTAAQKARFELYRDKNRTAYHNQVIVLEDWLLPLLYQQQPINLPLRPFYGEEQAIMSANQAPPYQPPETRYGFVGRDLEVLNIEKRLHEHNLLLIQGIGGAGKTTLLKHLINEWQATHFIKHSLYFSYDEQAYTRQELLQAIAKQLFSETDYLSRFSPLSELAQQAILIRQFRAVRYGLVLDNLESVTGAALAIPHCLNATERGELKDFLHALIGGKTLVLLGSRQEEPWLFAQNQSYHLIGLDNEAASILADNILSSHHVTQYRADDTRQDFLKLLTVLAGFPLAMEVVLAHLTQQTPAQILTNLQTADNKKQTILHCVEYSHGHLCEEIQKLFWCLAPFKRVLLQSLLDDYAEKFKAQPLLANVPFENWQTILTEAQWHGLMIAHETDGVVSLQPTLSYFLNLRLQQLPDYQQAIETAFREFYNEWSAELSRLMQSEDAQQKQMGEILTQLDYENLHYALKLALASQVSMINPYSALSNYLHSRLQQQNLELGLQVLQALESYPATLLQGTLGIEFVRVIESIATQELELKQYAEAQQTYTKSLSLLENLTEIDEKTQTLMLAIIYRQLGRMAREQKQWESAQNYYQQALKIDLMFNDLVNQAAIYHQLGRITQAQQQWQLAEDYYQQALALKMELGDQYSQANTYHQLGKVAQEQQQWQKAQYYYQKSLTIKIHFNDHHSQISTYHNLGKLAEAQKQWQQAQDYYQQALNLKIEGNNRHEQAHTYVDLGNVAIMQEQWLVAKSYLLKALALYVEFNDTYRIQTVALTSLIHLYHYYQDVALVAQIAALLNIKENEVLALLHQHLDN